MLTLASKTLAFKKEERQRWEGSIDPYINMTVVKRSVGHLLPAVAATDSVYGKRDANYVTRCMLI